MRRFLFSPGCFLSVNKERVWSWLELALDSVYAARARGWKGEVWERLREESRRLPPPLLPVHSTVRDPTLPAAFPRLSSSPRMT